MEKTRKNIDLSIGCVNTLRIEAAKKQKDFKNFVQDILEREAVRLAKKNKNK